MAKEIQFTGNAGANAYAIITNPADGLVRDVVVGSWDTYLDADVDDYDVVFTRKGTASQHYEADLPAGLSTDLPYKVDVFQRVGSNPAITDPLVGSGTIGPVAVDAALISGDALAADNLEAMLDGTGAQLYLKSTTLGQYPLKIEHTDQNGVAIKVIASDGTWLAASGADPTGTGFNIFGTVIPVDLVTLLGSSTDAANLGRLVNGTGAAVKTQLAALPPGSTTYLLTGTPNSVQWVYVRAVSPCAVGDGEPVRTKLRRVAFDGAGALIPDVPNAPIGLTLTLGPAGLVTAAWGYARLGQMAAPKTFNIYTTTGATPFNYTTPAGSVSLSRGMSFGAAFAHGTLARFVVRAVTASADEEPNTTEASATADAQAPTAPTDLLAEIIP